MAEKRSAKQKRKAKNNQQQSERFKQTRRQLEVELSEEI